MSLGLGCSAKPGKARDNRTGSWRTFIPRFRNEKCSKCGLCQTICPESCIRLDDEGLPTPDYDYCKGCGLCVEECPSDAIEMEQEEK